MVPWHYIDQFYSLTTLAMAIWANDSRIWPLLRPHGVTLTLKQWNKLDNGSAVPWNPHTEAWYVVVKIQWQILWCVYAFLAAIFNCCKSRLVTVDTSCVHIHEHVFYYPQGACCQIRALYYILQGFFLNRPTKRTNEWINVCHDTYRLNWVKKRVSLDGERMNQIPPRDIGPLLDKCWASVVDTSILFLPVNEKKCFVSLNLCIPDRVIKVDGVLCSPTCRVGLAAAWLVQVFCVSLQMNDHE